MLQNGFKKNKRVRLLTESLKETVLQAILARGDRKLGKVLRWAAENRKDLKDAFQFYHIMPEELACRKFETDASLPWGHLDVGVTKMYLIKERDNSKTGIFTPGCFDGCKRCGVCIND